MPPPLAPVPSDSIAGFFFMSPLIRKNLLSLPYKQRKK
nr:MAG TPA: hypothetical protein [Bacteriophage sp.]